MSFYILHVQNILSQTTVSFSHDLPLLSQSPPSKKRKLEKARKPLSFTLPEAGLKELQAKAKALGCTACSPVDSIGALLEKTLTDLRVSFSAALAQLEEGNPSFTLTKMINLEDITGA